jgi:hypothetical protein
VLKHLALFPLPVELRVLYGCDEIHAKLHEICKAMNGGFETQPRALQRAQCICELETMLKQLSERHLIIAVKPKAVQDGAAGRQDASSVHVRYILQNQLRGYICTEMDLSVPDNGEKNFFQLSLYCDQPKDLPTPTADHYELFRSILDRQTLHCRQTLWCLHQVKVDPDARTDSAPIWEVDPGFAYSGLRRRLAGDVEVSNSLKSLELDADLSSFHSVSQRIRAMYGLLRGSFSVGAITRLDRLHDDDAADEPLKRFGGWLRGVTNAAISAGELQERTDELGSLSKDRKLTLKASGNLLECTTNTALAPLAQPLYRDEFGWLFNERGVIALVQGHLYDAIPLFERAIVVMNHRDVRQQRDASLHAAVRRATLNLAIAQIERGNLEKAQGLISGLLLPEDPSAHLGSTISWVGAGYMGLIKHLGGDHSGALAAYDRVIKTAEEKEMLRLQSIFRRHRADLHRQMLHFKEAADDANLALAAAKQSAQRDLYWAAQLTLVKLALSQDQHSDSSVNKRLEDGLLYARNMSIPRLESEALRLQSALLLKFGDRLLAGRLAASAAAIARASGLRLMKVAAMRQYARVLAERGNLRNSVQISTQAHREAERRGYLNHAES